MIVSIIIPLYNKITTVERCINSVISQTYKNLEIIIIDDCSTDNSMNVVKTFDDSRIKIARRMSPGPGGYAARNLGIEISTGQYICFLDADDYLFHNHVEVLLNNIKRYDADISVSNQNIVSLKSSFNRMSLSENKLLIDKNEILDFYLSNRFIHTNNFLILSSVIKCFKFDESQTNGADVAMWLELIINTDGIIIDNCVTNVYSIIDSDIALSRKSLPLFHPVKKIITNYNDKLDTTTNKKLNDIFILKTLDWAYRRNSFYLLLHDSFIIISNCYSFKSYTTLLGAYLGYFYYWFTKMWNNFTCKLFKFVSRVLSS